MKRPWKPADTVDHDLSKLVMTIASDEEIEADDDSESENELPVNSTAKGSGKKRQRSDANSSRTGRGKQEDADGPLDPTFSFDLESRLGLAESQSMNGWDFKSEWCMRWFAAQECRLCRISMYPCLEIARF